jgi:RND family efflux transporter MFP subunit
MRAAVVVVFAAIAAPAAVGAAELLPVASVVVAEQPGLDVHDQLIGRVASARRSELGFERGGRLESIWVEAGDDVTAGQRLAALDVRQLEAQRRETAARLTAARADVRRVRAQLDLAATTRRRQADLFERGVAAAQERDEAVFSEKALEAQRGAAEAAVVATEAALASVDVALALSTLHAPYDGLVTRRDVHEGTIVAPGVPVLALIDVRREARVGIPLGKRDKLQIGDHYPIAIEGVESPGLLRRIVESVDAPTRTIEAVFELDPGSMAVDGAVARLRLASRIEQPGFWIPVTALTEGRRGLWSVLVLSPADDGAHRVERRDVQLLYVQADRAYVRGAIAAGERVATAGVERVVPGQLVRAVDG